MYYKAEIMQNDDRYEAVLKLSEYTRLVVVDQSPFWAMCEMYKEMRKLGMNGTLEGFYRGEPVFDPFNGDGMRIERKGI